MRDPPVPAEDFDKAELRRPFGKETCAPTNDRSLGKVTSVLEGMEMKRKLGLNLQDC